MAKPTYEEILAHPERYEAYDVRVETYRDIQDGNLLFITDDMEVLDGYCKVSDPRRPDGTPTGIPVVGKFESPMRRLALVILRGLARLLSPLKHGIGALLSRNLLDAAKQDGELKELLKVALTGVKRDLLKDLHALVRKLRTRKLVQLLDRSEDEEVSKADFLKELQA